MNHSVSARRLTVLPLLALAGLSGCVGKDETQAAAYCPNVAVLQQAQTFNTYLPGRTDPAALISTATVTGVAGNCTLAKNQTLVEVRFQAGFSATNGLANNGKTLTFPYFVSISQGDNIISKTNYSVTLKFAGNNTTATAVSAPVHIEMANVAASAGTSVLVGFQLTPDQLAAAASAP